METRKVELKVRLSLTRTSGGRVGDGYVPDGFDLTIEDSASHCRIAEIDIDVESFANLMSSRMSIETVPAVLYLSDKIGMVHQNKTVLWPLPPDHMQRYGDAATEMLARMATEVEKANPGWVVDNPGGWNMHKRHAGKTPKPRRTGLEPRSADYEFTLRRWVARKEMAK